MRHLGQPRAHDVGLGHRRAAIQGGEERLDPRRGGLARLCEESSRQWLPQGSTSQRFWMSLACGEVSHQLAWADFEREAETETEREGGSEGGRHDR